MPVIISHQHCHVLLIDTVTKEIKEKNLFQKRYPLMIKTVLDSGNSHVCNDYVSTAEVMYI